MGMWFLCKWQGSALISFDSLVWMNGYLIDMFTESNSIHSAYKCGGPAVVGARGGWDDALTNLGGGTLETTVLSTNGLISSAFGTSGSRAMRTW